MSPSRIHERSVSTRTRPIARASFGLPDCASLEANSHRSEVRRLIGAWIRRGMVRVAPMPGSPGRVRVYPANPDPSQRG